MHPHVEAEGGELPEVDVDNGYLGKDRRRTMPLLVAKDRRTHMLAGTAVESKRRHDYQHQSHDSVSPELGVEALCQSFRRLALHCLLCSLELQ